MLGDYHFGHYSFPFITVHFIFCKTFLDTIHEKCIDVVKLWHIISVLLMLNCIVLQYMIINYFHMIIIN